MVESAGIVLKNLSIMKKGFGGKFFMTGQPKEGLDLRKGRDFPKPIP